MRIKKRNKTIEIMKLYAIERRVPLHHSKREEIRKDVKIKQAEVKGEKEVDYFLDFLDEENYYILDDVRLPDHNGHFQMDSLILSSTFHLIVEVKNWEGTIIFGPNGQVTQVNLDGRHIGHKNPIPQVKTQVHRLNYWMQKHGFPHVPILHLVVISFPSTIIQPASPQTIIPDEVIHNSNIIFKIEEMAKGHTSEIMSKRQLFQMAHLLKSQHEPPKFNVLDKYRIQPDELTKGIICPKCGRVPMKREKRRWQCLYCGHHSIDAHYATLNDHILLLGNRVTNCELRDWLQVESRNVVKGLMKQADFEMVGKKKGSAYHLSMRII